MCRIFFLSFCFLFLIFLLLLVVLLLLFFLLVLLRLLFLHLLLHSLPPPSSPFMPSSPPFPSPSAIFSSSTFLSLSSPHSHSLSTPSLSFLLFSSSLSYPYVPMMRITYVQLYNIKVFFFFFSEALTPT